MSIGNRDKSVAMKIFDSPASTILVTNSEGARYAMVLVPFYDGQKMISDCRGVRALLWLML